MARLVAETNYLVVRLSLAERVGALLWDVRVPLRAVRDIRVVDDPWAELRGIRAPGTGLPRVLALGTRRWRGGKDFAAVYGRRPGVVIDLERAPFERLVVSCHDANDASAAGERIAQGVSAARSS